MKTKVLLIVLLMFLVNVVPLNAQETIKACGTQKVIEGWNILNFPSDGSKPHGRYIGWFLTLTNKLKLELVVEKVEDFKECTEKMRSGEIDLLTSLSDKDDRRDYMELIPFAQCSSFKWKCKGDQNVYYGISKKSKFISRISEFKSAILSKNNDYVKIYKNNFTSSDQHNWYSESQQKIFYLRELKDTDDCPNCDLSGVNLSYTTLGNSKFEKFANLSGANLSGANMEGAALVGANLSGANLSGANLIRANLKRVNLTGANLSGALLGGATLSRADLSDANLTDANLTDAHEGGANLNEANLSGANLSGANMEEATLIGANLSDANLRGANLSGANLKWTNLGGADLRDANLIGMNIDEKALSTNKFLIENKAKEEREQKEKEEKIKKEKMLALQKQKEKEEEELPLRTLAMFYQTYGVLKKCHEVRKGYELVHVNSVEMENIKSKAKSIENGIFNKYPEVKPMKDEIWEKSTTKISAEQFIYEMQIGGHPWGIPEMTSNLSDWQKVCNFYKEKYNSALGMFGGG